MAYHFILFQLRKALPEMYAASNVCLVPLHTGVATDSVPSKLLTITAAGRPLIASVDEDSDTYRFVEDAVCGLWVEPENPHDFTLYHDPDRRERLGRNGRSHVEARYTPQVVAQQYGPSVRRAHCKRQAQGKALLERTAEV